MPTVQLFATCLVDAFAPQVGESVRRILEHNGISVEVPDEQTCCGQPAFNVGFWDEARKMAAQTLRVLDATEGPIVLPSGSCADMILHHYGELVAGDPQLEAAAERVAARTREFTTYLVDDLGIADLGVERSGSCTLHHSCHGLRNLGIRQQPEVLVDHIDGLDVVDLPGADECCGFGGLFSVELPAVSEAMLDKKLDSIEATGADIVVGGDVSCLMHIAGGLHRRGSPIEVRHIAELLDEESP